MALHGVIISHSDSLQLVEELIIFSYSIYAPWFFVNKLSTLYRSKQSFTRVVVVQSFIWEKLCGEPRRLRRVLAAITHVK